MKFVYTIICLLMLVQAEATVRRVRAGNTSPGTGITWANAYSNLQTAINASASGDEVWVAIPVGTAKYQPASGVSFTMKNGVKIYGGFNGTENLLTDRDFRLNVVTLYGNNHSVVANDNTVTNSALLDGFTITGGTASFGGGMDNENASPTIQNIIFSNNVASYGGGGFYVWGGNPVLTNVIFSGNTATGDNNSDGNGGAIYIEDANPTITNCVFYSNFAYKDGGAVYSYCYSSTATKKPAIINSVFQYNESGSGAGGAVFGYSCSYIITNCTFATNYCYLQGCAGGVHNFSPSGAPASSISTPQIKNCLFWGNYITSNGVSLDLLNNNSTATVTYSMLVNPPAGAGNVAKAGVVPFVNMADGDGADNRWMTSDDGLQLTVCNALVIDKGDNTGTTSTDIAGQTRKVDVALVADGGSGTAPIVDMGAYEQQTILTAAQLAGTIGNAHLVPTPQEFFSDSVSNVIAPAAGLQIIRWETSANGSNWESASPGSTLNYYRFSRIGTDTLKTSTYFRRVSTSSNYCNTEFFSNAVLIRVNSSNGSISGKVFSNNTTTGVKGVTIKIKRRGTATPGSMAGYTYTAVTGDDGTYSINPIYYGDQTINTSKDSFWVIPVRTGHIFDRDSISKTLSTSAQGISGVDFKDLTTYAISGKTFQQLAYTNPLTGIIVPTQTCPLDSADIWKDTTHNTYSGFDGTAYGQYGVTISDPANIKLYPKFYSHKFQPDTIRLYVDNNFTNQDFKDTTTRVLSGSLAAGCGSTIVGTAALEFSAQTPDGTTCFTRIVRTDSTLAGAFSVRLPARKYKVRIIRFKAKAGANADSADVVKFINNLPSDSLTRNLTKGDTTLNLVYMRPPVISITGLNIVCNTPMPFAIIPQAITDSFKVFVTQGNYPCPVVDTSKIVLQTDIQGDDGTEIAKVALADTGTKVKLTGGIPDITSDHLKDLFINFMDKYGRPATSFNRKVLVTGIKSDVGTFTTVSPQIPLLVLHDPPGDQSYSTWQSNKTVENAVRFYSGTGNALGGWLEAKIGTKFQAGIGISTETSIWGSINGSINTTSKSTTSGEAILSTTTSQSFATANNPDVIGSQGDVYIGAALNLKYSTATDIGYSNCTITSTRRLAVADSGFATQYIYTESHIRNTIIPQLYMFISLTSNAGLISNYLNQIHVWQQVLDNNANNKSRAAFVENYSFNGAAGPYTNTTTTSSTKSSTIEFNMELEASVAVALGLEIAGSGISGGFSYAFKMETGNSTTNTVTKETSISYTLDDDDAADFFSVDVKKDPVYNTPVFALAAGTASCPPEEGAQPRDDIYLTATNPVALNVPAAAEATFRLRIVNTSQSHEPRRYQLSYDQGSNIDNETVKIAGSPYVTPVLLDEINYLDSTIKTVSITRAPGSSVYSYEGVRFRVSDICGGDISKTVIVTAQYVAPCSSVSLTQPENNWLITGVSNNLLFIKPGGYTLANLTSVTLEYSQASTSNWSQGPTLTPTQLTNGFNWNVATLADGSYNVRLRLDCQQGTTYSQRASGIIDRKAPTLFGRPDPTDDNYVAGDIISFSYNEKLVTPLDSVKVTMRRLGTNTLIPVTVSSYENKIIIVPEANIAAFTGDSVRVIVKDMADEYGNIKATPDTVQFLIGTTTVATGNNALTVSITNPTVFKNAGDTIDVRFRLPVNTANDMRVNYTVSGTAKLGIDYNIVYAGGPQPLYTSFNGSQSTVAVLKNTKETLLRIVPVSNYLYDTVRTINISLNEGGDYNIGTPASVAGKITSEDSVMVYKFIGDGNFNDRNNWDSLHMPFSTLIAGKKIIINPGGSGKCTLNVPLSLRNGSMLTIMTGKEFIVPSILKLQR